ncbi:MAG: hypothetical protein JXN62_10190, partial [Bacteroidales bacterium]|nr:hypothetical protein [Bacteroidales bacterium]
DGDGDGDGDTEIRSEIPKSFQTGVTFGASINTDNRLTVTIRTNEETLPLLEGHELLLSISVRKEVLKTISLKINSLSNSFILPLDDLPDGIIMLTLTTLENFPLSERLLFIQRDNNLRISIQPDKEVYKQHDPAAVKLTVSGNSSKEETVFLSLSAAEGNFSDDPAEFRTTISSWFLLESDVHGTVEGAYWYFDQANPDRKRDLDLLLRTQGWRDFSWKYDTTEFFYPEFGFNISGRLRKLNNDKPLVDSKANFMIIQGDKTLSEIVPADNTGRFMLENIDITGEASLIVSAVDRTDRPNGMIILDPVEYIPEKITDYISAPGVTKKEEFLQPIQADAMKEKEEVLVQEFEIREAIRKQYKLSDTIELREIIIAAQKPKDLQVARIESVRSIYGEPDGEVVVTSQLEKSIHAAPELLMGTVAGVYVTGPVRGHYSIRFTRSMGLSGSQGGSPLLVIDGVKRPLETLDLLPVAIIDRIDVLKTIGKTAVFGIDGANGVISVITRSGDRVTEKDEEAKHSVSTIIKGYDVPRIFYAPDSNPASSIPYNPDLRTTLLWKPDIILPVNGELILKYLNADNSATVRIIVEGLSSTGIPVSSTKEYKVTD